MESSSWPENLPSNRMKAIQELTQGQQLIYKLREILVKPEKMESVDGVVGKILGMFDNTLSILSSNSSNEIPRIRTDDVKSPSSWEDLKSQDSGESVKKISPSPIKAKRGCYQRRKNLSTYTKITSTLIDDGYAWRKYGQKVILKAKHQRNYFRCTHKIEEGCQATKQVQKTNDQPPKYKITYNGHHTCKNLQRAPQIIFDSSNPKDNSFLLNFEKNKITENKQVDPCFRVKEHTPDEGSPSLSMKHEHVSSSDHYRPWYSITQFPSLSSNPEHEDMISSGVFSSTGSNHGYEIDDMLGSNDFGDFPYELCS